jgi:urease
MPYKWRVVFMMGQRLSPSLALCCTDLQSRVFLVTVHDPICTESGNLEAALYGSFLPIPSADVFPPTDPSEYEPQKAPGAIIAKKQRIVINKGRPRIRLQVANNGDRPIQVSYCIYDTVCPLFSPSACRLGLTITS